MMRRTILNSTLAISVLFISACSNEAIYKSAQQNHALDCQKYPDSRYEDCLQSVEKSYDQYEEELSQVPPEQKAPPTQKAPPAKKPGA